MIFISHTKNDKGIVEPIASRLAAIYGQEQVFYDSWAIQPGDSIIGKMDDALRDCSFFFFFISRKSLESKMVTLEWQNALMKKASKNISFIPIKLDDCLVPHILLTTLYIDLNRVGIEVTIKQLVEVIKGNSNHYEVTPKFENLEAEIYEENDSTYIELIANHYYEPISSFLLTFYNKFCDLDEVSLLNPTGPFSKGEGDHLIEGIERGYWKINTQVGLSVNFPLKMKVIPKKEVKVKLYRIYHQIEPEKWKPISIKLRAKL